MKKSNLSFKLVVAICSVFVVLLGIQSCEDSNIKREKIVIEEPDFTKASGLEYYYPDSGGVATQLLIKGFNLGSDTSLLRVTVNNKNARIVGAKNDFVYAIVPTRADTGLVRLFLRNGGVEQEFVADKEFKYQFRRNVSTFAGQYDKPDVVDGPYKDAKFRRPWWLFSDKDGVVYVLEEGRGTDKNGALRRLYNGMVETLAQNNSGPFQSPTSACFSITQDTMFIANMKGGGVTTDANVIYSTRDLGFMQWRNLTIFKDALTTAVEVNPKTGEIFFNNQRDGSIYRYNESSPDKREKLWQVNNANDLNMRFKFDRTGDNLYISLENKHCIFKAPYDIETRTMSAPVLWVGEWGESGYVNGVGGGTKFNKPMAMDFDEDGNMYVGDRQNYVVRRITPDAVVSLWAGTPNDWGNMDGLPELAKLRDNDGLCITPDGAMYVTSYNGHNIRKIVVE